MASGWDNPNFRPPNWDAPNWRPPIHVAPAEFVAFRSAFLDRFGRFAKREEDVYAVRLWAEGADPADYQTLTAVEFNALSAARKLEIKNLESAAGYIDTSTKSNA